MFVAHLWQGGGVVRGVYFWVEEELWTKEALICYIACEVLPSLGIVAGIGLEILARLLIMLVELLQLQ